MFMSLISHLLTGYFCFALPSYATFKALSHRPISEPDLQRWSKYWAVIGALLSLEYVFERFISWFPFYWELKTLFLLFLALPQTQGSTFIYDTYLRPFYTQNEAEFDSDIPSIQDNALVFLQVCSAKLVHIAQRLLDKRSGQETSQGAATQPQNGAALFGAALNALRTYSSSSVTSNVRSPYLNGTPAASTTSFQSQSSGNPTMPVPFQPLGTPEPYHLD